MRKAELNIIVPILNERTELPEFLTNIERQQQVDFALTFVDGGSTDGSLELLQNADFPGRMVSADAGRGRQMNAGVQQARVEWLLFLHVDSRFSDPLALRKAIDMLQQTGSINLAGHFALKFRRREKTPSLAYYFYEWKARLGRPETIHGDQGFLLRERLFQQLNGFREELLVMEDTDFAERLREFGQWQLLPAEISTSARRFETEGLWQRQLLGALIMCFRDIGWDAFFDAAPDVYKQQDKTDKLKLLPFFELIRRLHRNMPLRESLTLWWRSGCYVRRNAWQLLFAIDVRSAFRDGHQVGEGELRLTKRFEPTFDLLTENVVGHAVFMLFLRLWFAATELWLSYKERR